MTTLFLRLSERWS